MKELANLKQKQQNKFFTTLKPNTKQQKQSNRTKKSLKPSKKLFIATINAAILLKKKERNNISTNA